LRGFLETRLSPLELALVQSITYSLDEVSTGQMEYGRYPTETLYDKTGVCEDTAILFTSILEALHFDAVLIIYPEHVATGVNVPGAQGMHFELGGRDYFYCESTGRGWQVGEIPPEIGMGVNVIQVP
jgi:hypothetical protein